MLGRIHCHNETIQALLLKCKPMAGLSGFQQAAAGFKTTSLRASKKVASRC